MEWMRWYHGAVTDDKWPLIARRSGQPVAVVVAVWAALLECASQAESRGSIEGFDAESIDAVLQLADGATQAVVDALSCGQKPRIAAGRVVNWEKRQPIGRDEGGRSTQRSREYRERQKALREATETQCNADATQMQRTETQCNADATQMQRTETQCNADATHRLDKRREEKTREEKSVGEGAPSGALAPAPPPAALAAPPEQKPKAKRKARADTDPEMLKFGENGFVRLAPAEYERLCTKFGRERTAKAIALLDLHIGAKGKDDYPGSHNLALQKWVFDAVDEREARKARASPAAPVKSFIDRQNEQILGNLRKEVTGNQ